MSVILKADGFTVPESSALNMRGLQTDHYNQVLGGHNSLVDPMQSGLTGILGSGATIENLIYGKTNGSVVQSISSQTIESAKGFPFANPASSLEYGYLPPGFNFLNLGSEPSVVVSAWLTHRDLTLGNLGIIGCAYQTTIFNQWSIATGTSSGTVALIANGLNPVNFSPELNTPLLHSMYFKRLSAGNMEIEYAIDDALIAKRLATYPFKNPGASVAPVWANPSFGTVGGFGYGWNGIIHRVQCFKVDPSTFNFNSWLVDELSGNEGRFVS